MAFGHGLDADFTIDVSGTPVAMEAYLENLNPAFTREIAEIRALGTSYVASLAGIRMMTMSADGKFDPTLDAAIYAAWNNTVTSSWAYYPQGNTGGNVIYSGECWVSEFSPGPAGGGDNVGYSFTIQNTGTITRGTV